MKRVVVYARVIGIGLAIAAAGAHAQVANGDFETGALGAWTTGGTNRVAVVQSSNFTIGTVNPPAGGTFFAALSNGPGAISSAFQTYDANTTRDYDRAAMSQNVVVTLPPAGGVLVFDYNFSTSEENEPNQYDDIFDVRTTIGAATSQVFSRSSCQQDGDEFSNFPNTACTGITTAVNWQIINAAPISGTTMRFGVGAWDRACVPIPNTVTGANTIRVEFNLLDQGDNVVDSVLLLDNIAIRAADQIGPNDCLRQITRSNTTRFQIKGATFVQRTVNNTTMDADQTGTHVAFASDGNYTGDNPNVIPQVFLFNGSNFERVASPFVTMTDDGAVDSLDLSDDDPGTQPRGDFLAYSVRPGPQATDNLDLHLYDRDDVQHQRITTTPVGTDAASCENRRPSISDDGTRVAFESTCNSLTGAGTTRRVVLANSTNPGVTAYTFATLPGATGTCQMQDPELNRNGVGRYLVIRSNCNFTGANADGSFELFWRDIQSGTWRQMTNLPAATPVRFDSISINGTSGQSGQFVFFVSNGDFDRTAGNQNADQSFEVFRYDVNASSGGTQFFDQLTNDATGLVQYFQVRAVGTATGNQYAYERFSLLTAQVTVGWRENTTFATAGTAQETNVLVNADPLFGLSLGIDGAVRVTSFITPTNPLPPQNDDDNPELFSSRN